MDKQENAYFFQRVIAFIIDMIIVGIISSLLSTPFVNVSTVEKLSAESNKVATEYMSGKIDVKTYLNQSVDISYEMARSNGISTIIEIVMLILYFVIYQFYNNGQTLGKKLMKIKVISSDSAELTMNQIIIRSLIVNFILVDMIILAFTIFANKDVYFYAVSVFEGLQYLIIIISIFMILCSSNRTGIHERLSHTRVIKLV